MDEFKINKEDPLVTFTLHTNKDIHEEIRNNTKKGIDYLEMCKEIAIMKEVKKSEGHNIKEKIDNTIKRWNTENNKISDVDGDESYNKPLTNKDYYVFRKLANSYLENRNKYKLKYKY